ncbi:hypothetical protein F0562_032330 [Nyssa sinensis]|uniref:C2 domain-containing protein n=1 Tax=Nyssa sinensis TaxID=561372 RepID=A0A5J5ASD1_9ASTE|nr:hypothetical protein F0562_032330 [Nyssa sinensis]
MILQSTSASCDFSQIFGVSPSFCPCKIDGRRNWNFPLISSSRRRKKFMGILWHKNSRNKWIIRACMIPTDGGNHDLNIQFAKSARRGTTNFVVKRFSDELDHGELPQESIQMGSNFTNFQEDPIVDRLRSQLGVIHRIPSPPINRNIAGLFVFFFFVGVVFDKLWTSRKRNKSGDEGRPGIWPQVPTSFSLFLEKDLQRKESVEWVNMVLGKLWKVYRAGIENWITGLLQPVIDNLKKPDYVQRVEIRQFSLGDEPLSVRNVERRTSRRDNDLQYQIGLRYTGGARMLLMLSLKFSIIPIVVPVGVRDFDIDGELWLKLRLIPTEPWVGAVSWAFVSLPKIKFELSPFRLFNLMAIPVLSMFLKKLLTEDLPRLFVRPKKIVLDFQKGKAVGPVQNDLISGEVQEGNKDFVGELSVTLVDARKLSYVFYGKTDPYVILSLGDQIIRSKKNSQTTVIGRPGEPIWNQDFHMLVANPRKQKLYIQVKDSLGFTDFTIGTGEVDLGSLKDTVPTDRIVVLQGGWGLFRKGSSGEILLRLTYKAYVEDEEDERTEAESLDTDASDDELSESDESTYEQRERNSSNGTDKESFMDVLAALIVSEEFQGIVASETANARSSDDVKVTVSTASMSSGLNAESKPSTPDSGIEGSGGSALLWLAVITSISVFIAINVGGSSFFNP